MTQDFVRVLIYICGLCSSWTLRNFGW